MLKIQDTVVAVLVLRLVVASKMSSFDEKN
jgi:hypothetical protein